MNKINIEKEKGMWEAKFESYYNGNTREFKATLNHFRKELIIKIYDFNTYDTFKIVNLDNDVEVKTLNEFYLLVRNVFANGWTHASKNCITTKMF